MTRALNTLGVLSTCAPHSTSPGLQGTGESIYQCEPHAGPRACILISRDEAGEEGEGLPLITAKGSNKKTGVGRAFVARDNKERRQSRVRMKACVKHSWLKDVIDSHLNTCQTTQNLSTWWPMVSKFSK